MIQARLATCAVQDRAGEIGVAEDPAAEVDTAEIHPGEHGPRAAGASRPQAIVLGADLVSFRLIKSADGAKSDDW